MKPCGRQALSVITCGAPRVQSIIAHSLIYILALSMLFRVTAWFGWFVAVALVFNAILLLRWRLLRSSAPGSPVRVVHVGCSGGRTD